jgi:DNA-binding NarL/FixJ family response regulator
MKKCTECPKYAVCKVLCVEAETYANQDYVRQSEISTDRIEYLRMDKIKLLIEWQSSSRAIDLTKREREILILLGKGLSRKDVCELLDITNKNLNFYVCMLSKKAKKL